MNEKIKNLSKKLEGLFTEPITPQSIYHQMREITRPQSDYFRRLGPETMIKLVAGVYSFKKTGNFKLGEKILNNLFFIHLFETNGEYSVRACSNCGGDGETDCEHCDEGEEPCQKCDASGKVECPICDGNDSECDECDGTGEVECPDCAGTGAVECEYCRGSGTYECGVCDGAGEVESDTDKVYEILFICSWNKDLKDECELKVNTFSPIDNVMSDNDYIILDRTEHDGEIAKQVEPGKFYCISYSDEPKMTLFLDMRISSLANASRLMSLD